MLFELLSGEEEAQVDIPKLSVEFENALVHFRAAHWCAAKEAFAHIIEVFGEDPPSSFYLRLCDQYQQDPPGPDWDGVVRMQSK